MAVGAGEEADAGGGEAVPGEGQVAGFRQEEKIGNLGVSFTGRGFDFNCKEPLWTGKGREGCGKDSATNCKPRGLFGVGARGRGNLSNGELNMKNAMSRFVLGVSLLGLRSVFGLEWREAGAGGAQPELRIPYGAASEAALMEMGGHGNPASVWLWAHEEGLALRVRVVDAEFALRVNDRWLWRGDGVYVELDGLGDNPERFGMGPDDLRLHLALSESGPVGRLSDHGRGNLKGRTVENLRIAYDAKAGVMLYEAVIPWSWLQTVPGVSRQIGVAVNVAHKDAENKDNLWGAMSNGRARSRGLRLLALEDPPSDRVQVGGEAESPLIGVDAVAEIPLWMGAGAGVEDVEVRAGAATLRLPAGAGLRGMIRVGAEDLKEGSEVSLRWVRGGVEEGRVFRFVTLEGQHRAMLARLDRSPRDTLLARTHVDSLRAMSYDVHARSIRLSASVEAERSWLETMFQWREGVLATLPAAGFDLAAHLREGLPLLLAYPAENDGSLQFASLQVPPDYAAEKPLPFVVYLHGAGPRRPADFLLTMVDNSGQDTLWVRAGHPEAAGSAQREVILLAPYGRGTQQYRGLAEGDVWQAIAWVETHLAVDPERRFMTGFSMGCGGAFRLAALKPDRWAAVVLAAGFHDRSAVWEEALYPAMRGIPKLIWCGDQDERMYQGLQKLLPKWEAQGLVPTVMEIAPGVVHTFPYAAYDAMLRRALF